MYFIAMWPIDKVTTAGTVESIKSGYYRSHAMFTLGMCCVLKNVLYAIS